MEGVLRVRGEVAVKVKPGFWTILGDGPLPGV